MKNSWWIAVAAGVLLAGCSQKPVVVDKTDSPQAVTVQYTVSTQSQSPQTGSSSMTNYQVAQRVDGDAVLQRLDFPGEMFPDNRARIMLSNLQNLSVQVLYADTHQPDPSVSMQSLTPLAKEDDEVEFPLDDKNLKKISKEEFIALVKAKGFTLEQIAGKIQATKEKVSGRVRHQRKLTFDPIGKVLSQHQELKITPTLRTESVTWIQYTQLPDPTLAVPSEIKTEATSELQGAARVPLIQRPIANKVLQPGEKPQLNPGEYIALAFTAPPGQGLVDPNKITTTITTRYSDIQINQVGEQYFKGE